MKKIIDYIKGKNRPGYSMKAKYVVMHNTANTHPMAGAEVHQAYAESNSRSASFHWAVDAEVAVGIVPENEMAWHAGDGRNGNGNKYGIAIEVCENGNWEQTYKNAVKLAAERLKANKLPITALKGHRDFSSKNCPRKLIPIWGKFVNDVKNEMGGKVNVLPPKPQLTVLRRGDKGQAVKLLQLDLLLLRYNIGHWGADGSFGPATETAVRQLQRENNLINDGIAGPKTQAKIKSLKTSPTKSGETGRIKIKVDGYWGKETTIALQKYFSTIVDGKISKPSMVIRKLQKHINAKPDGILGPETIGKLQQYLGTPVDKKISKPSIMVKEMQKKLNIGNF